ncbi:MAG: NAD-dependent epimerase/dehydratase family protein [Burkholderiaceae bacterium]
MGGERVLVTGGNGFVAGYCIRRLLDAGYRVRTTVRSPAGQAPLRAALAPDGAGPGAPLSVVQADLTSDADWPRAVAGCDFVLHVASPLTPNAPGDESELIAPAREGTLRVLRAARRAGVRRVVLTSSFAAVGYGIPMKGRAFTESDWTDVGAPAISAYAKSKTLAERAAWDFAASSEGAGMELATVNPVGVFGPVTGGKFPRSVDSIRHMMCGAYRGLSNLSFGVVDVRDVADLHVRAMTGPQAAGERFLAVAGDFVSMKDVALLLRERLGDAAWRVPAHVLPDNLVNSDAMTLEYLGKIKNATSEKAQRMLGWAPRPWDETIVSTARSLMGLGLLRDSFEPA